MEPLQKNIKLLVSRIVELLKPEYVYLYGSRARGDNHLRSDFDIAVSCPNNDKEINNKAWAQLHWELEEGLLTLYPVDILDLENASASLKEQVLKEGKVLYERN
jgi:predicted nucleotidyltransferase